VAFESEEFNNIVCLSFALVSLLSYVRGFLTSMKFTPMIVGRQMRNLYLDGTIPNLLFSLANLQNVSYVLIITLTILIIILTIRKKNIKLLHIHHI